jgi:hypothetical protein
VIVENFILYALELIISICFAGSLQVIETNMIADELSGCNILLGTQSLYLKNNLLFLDIYGCDYRALIYVVSSGSSIRREYFSTAKGSL